MFIIKYIIIPLAIVYSILIEGFMALSNYMEIDANYVYVIIVTWMAAHFIFGFRCWRRYPKFNDGLGIRNEIKFVQILALVLVILFIIIAGLAVVIHPDFENSFSIIMPIVCCAYSWILIIYPQKVSKVTYISTTCFVMFIEYLKH